MCPDDSRPSSDDEAAGSALRRALHEIATEQPFQLQRPMPVAAPRPGTTVGRPSWQATGLALAALLVAVAVGASLYGLQQPNSGPISPVEGTPAESAGPVTPVPSQAGTPAAPASFGAWQLSLDLTEKVKSAGASTIREQLGSAMDGVVVLKVYGFAATGDINYHITVYRSSDGISWQKGDVPNPINAPDGDVACRGNNCVVLLGGWGDPTHALEVTSDLQHWTSVAMPFYAVFFYLNALPTEFVIQGYDAPPLSPVAGQTPGTRAFHTLVSSDGLTWTEKSFGDLVNWVAVPGGGWVTGHSTAANTSSQLNLSVSSDGVTWHDVQDPDHLYSNTNLLRETVALFQGRWYLYMQYRQMPPGWQQGGLGQPVSTATPVASWNTIYWIDDSSWTLQSSGKISTPLPDQVVSANGILLGEKSNADFTAQMLISTDGLHWTDAGLMPPGVPVPDSIHGIPVYYLPAIAAAGPNVIVLAPSTAKDVWGSQVYVTKAGS